jgi:hypothetical protein
MTTVCAETVVPFGMTPLQNVACGKNFVKVLNDQDIETNTGVTSLARLLKQLHTSFLP